MEKDHDNKVTELASMTRYRDNAEECYTYEKKENEGIFA